MILTRHSHRKFPGRCVSRHSAASSDGLRTGSFTASRDRTDGTVSTWTDIAALGMFLQQRLRMSAAARRDLAGNRGMPAVPD